MSFDFELTEGAKVLLERPNVIDIEFNQQKDFFQTILGEKTRGRVLAKPYLTNKRILLGLLLVPFEIGEPRTNPKKLVEWHLQWEKDCQNKLGFLDGLGKE